MIRSLLFATGIVAVCALLPIGALYKLHNALPPIRSVQAIEVAAPDEPSPVDSAWRELYLPNKLCREECSSRYKRYRVQLSIPDDAGLYLPLFDSTVTVELDGETIIRIGSIEPPITENAYRPELIELPSTAKELATIEITVGSMATEGGRLAAFYVAPIAELSKAHAFARLLSVELTSYVAFVLLLVAFLALGIYVWVERHRSLLWFSLLCGAAVARASGVIISGWPADEVQYHALYLTATMTVLLASAGFVVSLRNAHLTRTEALLVVCAPVVAIATVVLLKANLYFFWITGNFVIQIFAVFLVPFVIWQLIKITKGDSKEITGATLGWLGVTVTLVLHDIYHIQLGETLVFQLSNLAGLSFVITFLFVLIARFMRLRQSEIRAIRQLADERQRLLADMHDTVAGRLTVLLQQVNQRSVQDERLIQTLQESLRDLRAAMDSLDERVSTDFGRALRQLEVMNRSVFDSAGVELVWQAPDRLPTHSAEIVLHIVRIVQEALTNALRHSGATKVSVDVSLTRDGAIVVVADNGTGLPDGHKDGRGLAIQRRRAEQAGLKLRVSTNNDVGTKVRLEIPADAPQSNLGTAATLQVRS